MFFAILLFPAVAYCGWRYASPIGRGKYLIRLAVASVLLIAIPLGYAEANRSADFPYEISPVAAYLLFIGGSCWGSWTLGRRIKDVRMHEWAFRLMIIAASAPLTYFIAIFLRSKTAGAEVRKTADTPIPKEPVMKHSQFSVSIPEGEEAPGGYVRMEHGTPYSIRLENKSSRRCNARIAIDGNPVGTFRIDQRSHIVLERPSHDTGRFTFFRLWTKEAGEAGIVKNESAGLISVTFIPEVRSEFKGLQAARLDDVGEDDAGGTGLTGRSSQRFEAAESMRTDESEAFTIHLRLVAKAPSVRPLVARSTPVPPPNGM